MLKQWVQAQLGMALPLLLWTWPPLAEWQLVPEHQRVRVQPVPVSLPPLLQVQLWIQQVLAALPLAREMQGRAQGVSALLLLRVAAPLHLPRLAVLL